MSLSQSPGWSLHLFGVRCRRWTRQLLQSHTDLSTQLATQMKHMDIACFHLSPSSLGQMIILTDDHFPPKYNILGRRKEFALS